MNLPRIVSVDDHVIEPPDLWTARIASRHRSEVPRLERTMVTTGAWGPSGWTYHEGEGQAAQPVDVWVYEDSRRLLEGGMCSLARGERDPLDFLPLSYERMPRGAYDRDARLVDMDQNNTEASLCFPTVSRFCGQFFMNRENPDLALECLRIYNDWTIDEWCAGPARGRLIPVTLVPMWDVELAAAEVRRCAAKGSHAIAFSECPPDLGLPSLYSGYWDPLAAACDETDTVVNMHIGTSNLARTAQDSPHITTSVLLWENGMHAAIDWILSGTLARFPGVRIAMSEAQVGWLPFVLERADNVWFRNRTMALDSLGEMVPDPPSSYVPGRVFGCIFDDVYGLKNRDAIGMEQILFETDYPHADSTWPESSSVAAKLCLEAGLGDHETWQLLRGNAIAAYRLDQYFGVSG